MDNNIAIKVENLSKKYCKSLKKSVFYGMVDIGRNMLGLSSHSDNLRPNEFWAVNNVSFEVKRGEALGLIGHNGSGKTTVLKLLNGIFWPDRGKITIKGRVGALIAVGAGFHPLLTGRENIYINGAILGMTKSEINKKFNSIVEFADIGDFLDSPVKHYSSGMFVRLGFAVAVHCEPDILLVDEVLAVGDRNFQIKCFRKMHELKKRNDVSIVFVSHNENNIREYTQKSIVLSNGKILFYGKSEDAISFYINNVANGNKRTSNIEGSIFEKGIIRKVTFKDGSENQVYKINTGAKIIIEFDYEAERKIKNPIFGITFLDDGREFTGLWNSYADVKLPDINGEGKVRVSVEHFDLPVGSYNCYVVVCEEEESSVLEWRNLTEKLIVERSENTYRYLKLKQSWEIIE